MPPDGFKLHLGCGKRILQGYINSDLYENTAPFRFDLAETGFTSNTVKEILCIHVIEHLEPVHFDKALNHWYDILKDDGVVKLRCPNAVIYIKEWLRAYDKADHKYLDGWGRINVLGHSKHFGTLNRQLLTPELLTQKLKNVGFSKIMCKVGETRPEQRNTFEYRSHGDIQCEARL
jgi:predicted SAM-dependent methyltransferase